MFDNRRSKAISSRVPKGSLCVVFLVLAAPALVLIAQNTPTIPERHKLITIRPDGPSADVRSLLNAIRASDATEVRISLGERLLLEVRPEAKPDEYLEVKPDPTMLIVTADAKGDLQLNNEKLSNLSDTSPLIKHLRRIFKDREDNGVLRPDTNEIEKTVWLRLHPSLKVRDLTTLAAAVQSADSDRIGLWIDERSPFDPIGPIDWTNAPSLLNQTPTPKPNRKPRTRKPN